MDQLGGTHGQLSVGVSWTYSGHSAMHFPLGKPILALIGVAVVTGTLIVSRIPAPRPAGEVWTFAQSHADVYRSLAPSIEPRLAGELTIRLIPNNALNIRLVSLFMAERSGSDLPDVVEIRQDALGRYLGPAADQIGLLPLDDLLDRPLPDGAGTWRSHLVERRLLPYSKSGRVFGLPRDIHPTTLSYRADLFAEAGVDLEAPTPGHDFVTWPDFQRRCLRFQAYWRSRGVNDRWAIDLFSANADLLAALLLQRGVNLIDADGKLRLTDPIVVDTLLFYAGLVAGPDRISTDSVSAGRSVWSNDLASGLVCAVVTPDWRVADLKSAAPQLAGKWKMIPLPRFAETDSPTTTWGGTMIAIPRRCRDPEKSWQIVRSLYLSDAAMEAQTARLGILPASPPFWRTSPAVQRPDAYFGGQPILRLYADLAPHIPEQVLTPDTAYATAALGYVLTQTVGAMNDLPGAAEAESLRPTVEGWLADRQADVERQMAHGRLSQVGNDSN